MSLVRVLKRLHKWFAVIVGIQLFLWVVSGLVFSFINHKEVGGNFIFKNQQKDALQQSIDFTPILSQFPNATKISLINVNQQTAIKVETDDDVQLINGNTYEKITVTESLIKNIADASYRGGGELVGVNWIESRNDENRGMKLPIWQLVYNDQYNSHLYLSADTGEYQGIRTDNWRIFDFFMMLHFMDFGDRGNFNNGLIIFFASVLVLFALSGMLLVYSSFSLADFSQLLHRFIDNRRVNLTIRDQQGQQLNLKVVQDSTLMDALFEYHVTVDSDCGGGGICGTCRVKVINLKDKNKDDLTEHQVLSDEELAEGYRLSCQLALANNVVIELADGVSINNKD